jgi:HPt (histidine-containing phosphotransfer) domain-containing protein
MRGAVNKELLDRRTVKELQVMFDTEDPGTFASLIEEFLISSRRSLLSIKEAVSKSDWDETRRVAHRLMGMSSQLGAVALRDESRELKAALDDGEIRSPLDRVRTLENILQQTADAYEEVVGDFERTGAKEP